MAEPPHHHHPSLALPLSAFVRKVAKGFFFFSEDVHDIGHLMGFPAPVYSEVPRLLLDLVFLLDHLRRLSSWLLCLAGAGTDDGLSFHYSTASGSADNRHHQEQYREDHCIEELKEHSPAVRFDALSASSTGDDSALLPEGCAVCLGDFHGAARVRWPRGCRHVFHRACLDRWAGHGRRTCPLCRAPFLPPFLLPLPHPTS